MGVGDVTTGLMSVQPDQKANTKPVWAGGADHHVSMSALLAARDMPSMPNTAIYLVCLNTHHINLAMTRLAILSLRNKAHYAGDILVFTDRPQGWEGLGDGTRIVPVDTSKRAGDDEGIPWQQDPRLFRILVTELYDLTRYDMVLYLDYDVLVDGDLQPVFAHMTHDALYFTYAARRPWVDPNYPSEGFLSPYLGRHFNPAIFGNSPIFRQSVTGVCSGIFAMRGNAIPALFSRWRQYVRQRVAAGHAVTVQTALNELLLMGDISGKSLPNEWIAYPLSPLFNAPDQRSLLSQDRFLFHHFNPGKAGFKLVYMKNHYAFGSIG